MKPIVAHPIFQNIVCEVGEGPFWDSRLGKLCWVDVHRGRMYVGDLLGESTRSYDVDNHLSMAVPRAAGGWLLGLGRRFTVLGTDGSLDDITSLPDEPEGNRLNDGTCDTTGRLWAGTMAYDHTPGAGSLYRLSPDGIVDKVLGDITISNGIDWSPDGTTMYYVDTATNQIDAFQVDMASDTVDNRRTLAAIAPEDGKPDGLCTDHLGGIWVAVWGAGQVRRYRPDGSLDAVVSVPTENVSSCCFGGPDGRSLFITTAAFELNDSVRSRQRSAGMMHACTPGVRGAAARSFAYG